MFYCIFENGPKGATYMEHDMAFQVEAHGWWCCWYIVDEFSVGGRDTGLFPLCTWYDAEFRKKKNEGDTTHDRENQCYPNMQSKHFFDCMVICQKKAVEEVLWHFLLTVAMWPCPLPFTMAGMFCCNHFEQWWRKSLQILHRTCASFPGHDRALCCYVCFFWARMCAPNGRMVIVCTVAWYWKEAWVGDWQHRL